MALLTQLIKTFKDKAPGQQKPVGQPSVVQGQGTDTGIVDPLEQFRPGSERPGAAAEREELNTNRRTNRSITDGIRATRVAGRFGTRNVF